MKKKFDRLAEASKTPVNSLQDADENIFGVMDAPDVGRQTARPLDIDKIYPDVMQPRRAIPSEIRRSWDGRPSTITAQVLRSWLVAVEQERGSAFNLAAHFESGDGASNADHNPGPLEDALLRVVRLAATIHHDGLTNPITVIRQPDGFFQLETGERRWLAYHLLRELDGDDWGKIPAREMKEFDVWRQASENNARSDLNAIAKARQIAILLMDAWSRRDDCPVALEPLDRFEDEQAFYAQALHLPTPYGEGQRLLDALGFKNMSTLSRHKNLLELAPAVWIGADDTNCPEGVLRDLLTLPHEQQVALFAIWQRQNFAIGKDSTPAKPKPKANDDLPAWQRTLARTFAPKQIEKMSTHERREALAYLRALVAELEALD